MAICGGRLLGFPSVGEGVVQHLLDVRVSETIVDVAALSARPNEPGVAKRPKLVADGRLADVEGVDDLVHALLALAQKTQDPKPGRIREAFQQLHGRSGRLVVEEIVAGVVHQSIGWAERKVVAVPTSIQVVRMQECLCSHEWGRSPQVGSRLQGRAYIRQRMERPPGNKTESPVHATGRNSPPKRRSPVGRSRRGWK